MRYVADNASLRVSDVSRVMLGREKDARVRWGEGSVGVAARHWTNWCRGKKLAPPLPSSHCIEVTLRSFWRRLSARLSVPKIELSGECFTFFTVERMFKRNEQGTGETLRERFW